MSQIKELLERVKPALHAALEDITAIGAVQVMILVRDHIIAKHGESQTMASRMAMAMTVNATDQNDVEAAAEILCLGVDLVVSTINKLAGYYDQDMVLDACRMLSVER